MTPAKTSVALLAIQLALVSSIAVKYAYERAKCPRVWTRTLWHDPDAPLRGRYQSLQLIVDGCKSTLPSAKQAGFPRDVNGVPNGEDYSVAAPIFVEFAAQLAVRNNRLVAIRISDGEDAPVGENVIAQTGISCDAMRLSAPVNFYTPEHAPGTLLTKAGQELWVEVTVPPKGPPRPIQLALKDNSAWKPLAFQ
jgi:hypothetical protein